MPSVPGSALRGTSELRQLAAGCARSHPRCQPGAHTLCSGILILLAPHSAPGPAAQRTARPCPLTFWVYRREGATHAATSLRKSLRMSPEARFPRHVRDFRKPQKKCGARGKGQKEPQFPSEPCFMDLKYQEQHTEEAYLVLVSLPQERITLWVPSLTLSLCPTVGRSEKRRLHSGSKEGTEINRFAL